MTTTGAEEWTTLSRWDPVAPDEVEASKRLEKFRDAEDSFKDVPKAR